MTNRVRLALALLILVSAYPLSAAASTTSRHRGAQDRCDAITVRGRPRGGDRSHGFDWTPYLHAHDRYLQRHPDFFASGYFSGKHFYVGFTTRVCHHLDRIRDLVDKRWRFRAFIANYSWRQLQRATTCVSDLAGGGHHLGISSVGTKTSRNKLAVTLHKPTRRRKHFIRDKCSRVPILFSQGDDATYL